MLLGLVRLAGRVQDHSGAAWARQPSQPALYTQVARRRGPRGWGSVVCMLARKVAFLVIMQDIYDGYSVYI